MIKILLVMVKGGVVRREELVSDMPFEKDILMIILATEEDKEWFLDWQKELEFMDRIGMFDLMLLEKARQECEKGRYFMKFSDISNFMMERGKDIFEKVGA